MKTLREILDSGLPYDSICFKDASGTSNPKKVYETIRAARKLLGDKEVIWMHSHETAGVGITQYKAAIEAGADGVDLARSPLSGGTCQPDILSMWHALKDTEYTLDIDYVKILEANRVLENCLKDYFFPPEARQTSSEVILSPMPGGALTSNTMMMRDTGTLHLYPKVIEAMTEVVKRGGYATSVTPVSQFYFQQAYTNVTEGKWKKITPGYGDMVLGYFGHTPVDPDPEIVALAEKQLGKPVFKGDPIEILEPGIPKAEKLLKEAGLPVTDENVFIVGALAGSGVNKGLEFLKGNKPVNVRKITNKEEEGKSIEKQAQKTGAPALGTGEYIVTFEGTPYSVTVEESSNRIEVVKGVSAAPSSEKKEPGAHEITAKMQGVVAHILVSAGDEIQEGDTLLFLEAMKMEFPVASPISGTVQTIDVKQGDAVDTDQVMITVS